MRPLAALALLILSACTQFPELDARVGPDATRGPYPDLVPVAPLVARADGLEASPTTSPEALANVDARIARLKARAAGLRGPVIPAPVRTRMLRGVATAALQ